MPRNRDPVTYVNYGVADSNSDPNHANQRSRLAQEPESGTDPHHANHSSLLQSMSAGEGRQRLHLHGEHLAGALELNLQHLMQTSNGSW